MDNPMEDILKKYKINFKDWLNYGQWEQPPMSAYFWVYWYDENICKKLGIETGKSSVLMLNGNTMVLKRDHLRMRRIMEKALKNKNEKFFRNFKIETEKIFKEQQDLQKKLDQCIKLDFELFDEFIKTSLRIYSPWFLSVILGGHIGDYIIKFSEEKGYEEKDILRYIKIAPTLMMKEYNESVKIKKELEKKKLANLSIAKLIKELEKEPDIFQKIKKHVDKYTWVGTHHLWGEPLSLKKYLKDLKNVVTVDKKENLPTLPDDLRFIIEAGREIGFIRQYSAEIFNVNAYKARPLLRKIAKSFGLTYEELLLLTPTEIMNFHRSNTKPNKEQLFKRKNGHCILLQKNEEVIIDKQKEISKLLTVFVPANTSKKLSGVIANRGYARGKARIFLIPKNLEKMKVGDILVTPMTTPDFIPLMKKAGAIITDIGGLLSHAAIISRELGKPCIIGTRFATITLKDGDLVEVDANRGIVRIINKSKK